MPTEAKFIKRSVKMKKTISFVMVFLLMFAVLLVNANAETQRIPEMSRNASGRFGIEEQSTAKRSFPNDLGSETSNDGELRRRGEGIGNNLTLGKLTFIMIDRDNPDTVLGGFTTEAPIGRLRGISELNIPGWRVDRRSFRNEIRANRGTTTIRVPMVRDDAAQDVPLFILRDR